MREVEAYRRFKCARFYVPQLSKPVLIKTLTRIQASEHHSNSGKRLGKCSANRRIELLLGFCCGSRSRRRGKNCLPLPPSLPGAPVQLGVFRALMLFLSGETCKMLSTLTRSTAPASPKKRWSNSSKAHAKPSAPCTTIELQLVLNLVRPQCVRIPIGFPENSSPAAFRSPSIIRTMKTTKGSLKPTEMRRGDTRTITRAPSPSLINSQAGKGEVLVGRRKVG